MTKICIYFQVHQPIRLARYSVFGNRNGYFDDNKNKEIFERISKKCYFPANEKILELIKKYDGKFKVSFSMTGVFLEQAQKFNPGLIQSFQDLVKTNYVNLLNETYYHSFAFLISHEEFREQVELHKKIIYDLFKYSPIVFRNTEALYHNEIAKEVENMGYKAIIAEGWQNYLQWRSPNFVYKPVNSNINLLLRNYQLSDDIAFRFSSKEWSEFPLTADKYANWISRSPGDVINIFIDYETFGEHQWEETGIFKFLEYLPKELLKYEHLNFVGVNDLANEKPVGEVDVPYFASWADTDRDLSAWFGNKMQQNVFDSLKNMENQIKKLKDHELLSIWRKLQTSDHFYYMCTKWFADGDIHKYFNPYNSPYEAYINYMNILQDFKSKIMQK